MRLLHTADWHLGHTLHDFPREAEHQAFLSWLLDQLGEHAVDALLIAGDVFETANPPVRAEEAWYTFLADARGRYPDLDILVTGGNHDSAARLDAPNPVLRAMRVTVLGGLPRRGGRAVDLDRLVQPLHKDGQVTAWVAAVPYLRLSDLPRVSAPDPIVEGIQAIYQQALGSARSRRQPGQALLAMGHLACSGARLSPLSERRIQGGEMHSLPDAAFPSDLAYVALGHLHLAQTLSGRENVRYSGSPIPLNMGERNYEHQVVLVDLDGEDFVRAQPLMVPRRVDFLRVPDQGELSLAELLPRLEGLPDKDLSSRDSPFLEVRVRLDKPQPLLRQRVERALEGKDVRLVTVKTTYTGDGQALSTPDELEDLDVTEVFRRRWKREHSGDPTAEVLHAFHLLLEQLQRDELDHTA